LAKAIRSMSAVRNLLLNLVRRDLTVRYKSTVLGFFWSFIKPLAMTAIFYVIFDRILNLGSQLNGRNPQGQPIPFALHLLAGMLAWTFFAGATGEAMNSILANGNLIKKVRLPLPVFPLAAVCSHMVHFVLGLLVLAALLIAWSFPPSLAYLLLPAVVALQFLMVYAVAMALAALNVFFRDVSSIWEVLTTAWFYATPIVYPVFMATSKLERTGHGWLKWLYLANPMTPIVLAYRRLMIYAAVPGLAPELPDTQLIASLGLCLGMSIALFILAWFVFSHFSKSFADEL
jgi:ABC-type polysaccharide/polyol phosphate export permease